MTCILTFSQTKTAESCPNSLAYQLPSPWTMGVLGVLAEIEVLFMNLDVDLKEVTPSLLMDRVREVEGNPDISKTKVGPAQQPMVEKVKSSTISTLNQVASRVVISSSSNLGGHSRILSQLPSWHAYALLEVLTSPELI